MLSVHMTCAGCANERTCWHTGARWMCADCWKRVLGRAPSTKEYHSRLPVSGQDAPNKSRYERERDARRQT